MSCNKIVTLNKMAAPLKKVPMFCQRQVISSFRPSLIHSRFCSSKEDDSPPPWAPRQVPLGNTFKAIYLTKSQNKAYWRGLHEKLNRRWKKDILKMKQHIEENTSKQKPEPPLLHMVIRVKPLGGRPYWEKDLMKAMGLDGPVNTPKIFVNKATVNARLEKVKHLVEILPVRFPYGLPETEEDYEHCILRDNGDFVVTRKLEAVQEETAVVSKEDPTSVWDLKQETIDKTLEIKKMQYQLSAEYFPTVYTYKRNEDGKEYRYKGNFNIGAEKKWY